MRPSISCFRCEETKGEVLFCLEDVVRFFFRVVAMRVNYGRMLPLFKTKEGKYNDWQRRMRRVHAGNAQRRYRSLFEDVATNLEKLSICAEGDLCTGKRTGDGM